MAITPQQLIELSQVLQAPGREQMPWERRTTTPIFDMFGSQEDDPAVRRARELEHDRAQAAAELQARISNPRAWETPEDIAEEVNLKYGLQMPGQRNKLPPLVKAGSTVLTPNEQGELEVAYQEPRVEKPVKHRVPFKVNPLGEPTEYVSMTEDEIIEAVNSKSLPEAAAQSEVVKYVTSRFKPSAASVPVERKPSFSFMGPPGGRNLIENPFERGLNSTRSQTSKKLTRELATDFLRRANGDKTVARRLAKEAGYEP